MPWVERLYEAARNAGLLTVVRIGRRTVHCGFEAPEVPVLDGLALNHDARLRYPVAWLVLNAGDVVTVGAQRYTVREVRHIGNGEEQQAWLTQL